MLPMTNDPGHNSAPVAPLPASESADPATESAIAESQVEAKGKGSARKERRRKPETDASTSATEGEPSAPATKRKQPEPDLPVTPELLQAIEAILLSTDKAVSAARLAEAFAAIESSTDTTESTEITPTHTRRIKQAIEQLNTQYTETRRVFRIEALAGGFRVMTTPAVGHVLRAFHGARERASLSRAALESLAIIAYKQPLTRAKLEAVRGVACGEILRSLTERRLVTIVGRAEELGRPILYGTTKQFLEAFGLASTKDLPTVEEFKARAGAAAEDDDD